jgi:hypothetical protein
MRPAYLQLYDRQYFAGGAALSSYGDYARCRDILWMWAGMLDFKLRPTSVLDVAAAYGYVVEWFRLRGVRADGVEPSEWARQQAAVPLLSGWLPDVLPVTGSYHVVTCTECLEHLPTDDVSASLQALRDLTEPGGYMVLLIMVEGHPTAHDDAGHLTIKPREWWTAALADIGGVAPVPDVEAWFNQHPTAVHMKWDGRIFVRQRT